MTSEARTSNSSLQSPDISTSSVASGITLVNVQQASNEDGSAARTDSNRCNSQLTPTSAAATSPVASPGAEQRNRKPLSFSMNSLIKCFFSKEIKMNVATLTSVTLAVLAVVYTILSDNVGQKQLDLGMWVFCKSYPDDPQVQNSTACQMYSQKKSLDDLRRRDRTTLSEAPIQILDSVPDWLSVPSRIDRHSCQVVCWNSASSHTHVALASTGVSRSYLNTVDSIRSMLFESVIPRLRITVDSLLKCYVENRDKISSLVIESVIPQLKVAIGSPTLSYAAITRSLRSFILDSVIPQLRKLTASQNFSYMEVLESVRSLIFVDSIRSLVIDPGFPQLAIALGWPKLSFTEVGNSIRSQILDPTLRKYIVIDVILWLGLKALAPGVVLVTQLIYQYGMLLVKILCRPAIRISDDTCGLQQRTPFELIHQVWLESELHVHAMEGDRIMNR
ncbi:uncharacterized protein LY89DRAFT_674273 [Mollisia scopiformis]|uniref:Uncharacterized protein n=1 Tax=Mollisia scopiformis TaxID=149040 RepID=A0A194WUR7_MOLSC|nr:uncharacterized protein LY89DRAFT_674273 [Mollisia scopiformis]KUJ11708.1 hypothetical protein LY89DRAFT_674273 [Mollisia scopiformis]